MRSQQVIQLAADVLRDQTQTGDSVPRRQFGRASDMVSTICLGGWHSTAYPALQGADEGESIRLMHAAVDMGVNFFDNAWEYHNGYAEEVMGRALAMDGKRKNTFLMSKVCNRDYAGALEHLEDSLRRLQTDYLDLWMFHELSYDNDPDWLFERGAVKAAMEAKAAGKVRYIGFTGHKAPWIHRKALEKDFVWDAALMPINLMDAHYRSFANEVVPMCHAKGVAPIGMKGLGGGFPQGRILERLAEQKALTPGDLLAYALSQPTCSQVVGITNMEQLKFAVAVSKAGPLSIEAQDELLSRVVLEAGDGRFETFKSTGEHDGPLHRRQHEFAVA